MKPQVHFNVSAPTPEGMEPITQAGWQPNGGLWTFTNSTTESFAFWTWLFKRQEQYQRIPCPRYVEPGSDRPRPLKAWLLYPSRGARIATIDSRADLLDLGQRYGWCKSCFERRVAGVTYSRMNDPAYSLNFIAMAQDFDALHVTDSGIEQLETLEAGEYRLAFWEAESTCWFKWSFDRVEDAGFLSDYEMPVHGVFNVLYRRRRSWEASGQRPFSFFG